MKYLDFLLGYSQVLIGDNARSYLVRGPLIFQGFLNNLLETLSKCIATFVGNLLEMVLEISSKVVGNCCNSYLM